MPEKKLIISVHDVSPAFKGEITEIIDELDIREIDQKSILVVPNWGGKNDLRDDDSFAARLRVAQASGDEILQHGYDHFSPHRKYGLNPIAWFMGEQLAQGQGEFQNLSLQSAKDRIYEGGEIMRECGLVNVNGFVAPAWLTNNNVRTAIKEAGFDYHVYTSFWKLAGGKIPIEDLRDGHEGEVISNTGEIAFEPSRRWVDLGSRLMAKVAVGMGKNQEILRIAIHPNDVRYSKPFDYALTLITDAMKDREVCTYRDLL